MPAESCRIKTKDFWYESRYRLGGTERLPLGSSIVEAIIAKTKAPGLCLESSDARLNSPPPKSAH